MTNMAGRTSDSWNARVRDEFIDLMTDEFLGGGMSRLVYVFGPDPRLVVKIETGNEFQNVLEFETWRDVRDTKWAKWFAPCYGISGGGAVLLQQRTTPITGKMPALMPHFLDDFKPANFGKIGRQVVAHDYGYLSQVRGYSDRMKKVAWDAP